MGKHITWQNASPADWDSPLGSTTIPDTYGRQRNGRYAQAQAQPSWDSLAALNQVLLAFPATPRQHPEVTVTVDRLLDRFSSAYRLSKRPVF
jgi:hypothetical protein